MISGSRAPEDRLASFISACGGAVRQTGKETVCQCPAHDDANPSLNQAGRSVGKSACTMARMHSCKIVPNTDRDPSPLSGNACNARSSAISVPYVSAGQP